MTHPIDAEEADFIEGFYYRLSLTAYASMHSVAPLFAATLLSAKNPVDDTMHDDGEVKTLALIFEDVAQFAPAPRSMWDWVQIARNKEVAHSKDIAAYLEFKAQKSAAVIAASQQSQGAHSSPKAAPCNSVADTSSTTAVIPNDAMTPLLPVQQSAAQEAAIRAALHARGHSPQALPVAPLGRAGVKAEIKKAIAVLPLFVSNKTFDMAWQRMRDNGDIADAS